MESAYRRVLAVPLRRFSSTHNLTGSRGQTKRLCIALNVPLLPVRLQYVLPICYGGGNNGKSTLWGVVERILGDYSKAATQELLLPVKQQHPTIIADLYQKRFVPIAEIDKGRHLAESVAKTLTGGDVISARRMQEDYWTFKPSHKIWLSSNHKPKISGTDTGIWRRVKLIPFLVDITTKKKVDPGFKDWLILNESSGILNWLVEGYQDWRANGLIEPDAVREATSNYRDDSDSLAEFLSECCEIESNAVATSKEIYAKYCEYCERSKFEPWSHTKFGSELTERGFIKEKPTSGEYRKRVIYKGIRVSAESNQTQEKQGNLESAPSCPHSLYSHIENCANPIGATYKEGATRGNSVLAGGSESLEGQEALEI